MEDRIDEKYLKSMSDTDRIELLNKFNNDMALGLWTSSLAPIYMRDLACIGVSFKTKNKIKDIPLKEVCIMLIEVVL